mmetsp:Transcript_29541/g.78136  ORF Transcript_29541/g.78136 Transcript_29541/m.78136 type:complete len:274 (-) Transcript_29541:228-1049(-)
MSSVGGSAGLSGGHAVSLAGTWNTPLPTKFEAVQGADGKVAAGEVAMFYERDSHRVLLSSLNSPTIYGTLDEATGAIKWSNGSKWTRAAGHAGFSAPSQEHFLSVRQCTKISHLLADEFDIPVVGEVGEGHIFSAAIRSVNAHLGHTVTKMFGEVHAMFVKTLLDETKSLKHKEQAAKEWIRVHLRDPFVAHISGRCDLGLGASMRGREERFMTRTIDRITEAVVDLVVGMLSVVDILIDPQEKPKPISFSDLYPVQRRTRESNRCSEPCHSQ